MPNIKCLGLLVSEKKMFEQIVDGRTDGRTDARTVGRRTKGYHKSSPWHFVPGELKMLINDHYRIHSIFHENSFNFVNVRQSYAQNQKYFWNNHIQRSDNAPLAAMLLNKVKFER